MTGENGGQADLLEAQGVLGSPSGQVLPLMNGDSGLAGTAGYLAAQRTPQVSFARADVIAELSTLPPLLPGDADRRSRRSNSGATTPLADLQPSDRIRTHIKVTEMSRQAPVPNSVLSGCTEASRHTDPGIQRQTMRKRGAAAAVRRSDGYIDDQACHSPAMTRCAIPKLVVAHAGLRR